jgi:diguanylate cyclase (GGDEF)-like protein
LCNSSGYSVTKPKNKSGSTCRRITIAARNWTIAIQARWQQLRQHFTDSFAGEFAYRRRAFDAERLDELIEKRQRDAYRYILLLLIAILVPVTAHSLYIQQILPTAAGAMLIIVLVANIWLLSKNREAFLTPPLVIVLSMALVLLLILIGQRYNLYWLYPLLVALPVLMRARWSIWMGILCGVIVTPLVFANYPTGLALVICLSMVLTWLVSAWLVFAVSEQSRRLKGMAITDSLTGAYNRRYFELQADQARAVWARTARPSTLLLLDIDFFKRINDRFGHSTGDAALKGLVEVISGRIRNVDILCRYGGEEFVVLLNDTGPEAAMGVADDLRQRIESAPIVPDGNITVSIGICGVAAADNLDHWLNLADGALYLAKRNGRNRLEMAKPELVSHEPLAKTVPDWR